MHRTFAWAGLTFAFATLALSGASCGTPDRALHRDASLADGGGSARPDAREDGAGVSPETTLHLASGKVVRGPLAAVYDHSLFWDASARKTYAMFDPTKFAAYPSDGTLQFFPSQDIVSVEGVGTPPASSFVEFQRREGIVLHRPPLEGVSYVIRGNDGYHLEEDGYGNFAWDLVRTFPDGSRFKGSGAANSDYATWNEPVVLPSAGIVIEVVRSAPDNAPGAYPEGASNNFVGVYLGGHYYVYILHFRQNTIPSMADGTCEPVVPGVPCVEVGAYLPEGAYLGRAGNSGVTLEPHVHTTLLYYTLDPEEPRTWSVPGEFTGLFVADSVQPSSGIVLPGPSKRVAYTVPRTGTFISHTAF
ncbi:MAG: hypothetical protein U0174_18545 [Polyangiaceae bacterium]